jgi:hypothetical protein
MSGPSLRFLHTLIALRNRSMPLPALRQIISTWTSCGLRLVPRRANDGYTAELLGALVSDTQPTTGVQVVRPAAPHASTRSLWMPAGRASPSSSMTTSYPPAASIAAPRCDHSDADLPCASIILIRLFIFDLPFPTSLGDLSCGNCAH